MRLFIIRGLPGSGKSTYAKSLGIYHVEADMFHMKNGAYCFDAINVKDAHNWCQTSAWHAMQNGMDVVISNTFTRLWEIKPYLDFANKTGHFVYVVRMINNFNNIHNVPAETIKNMKERFEDFNGESFICEVD